MHPLEVIFKKAVEQVASGKGNERHGDGGDFMIQPWVNITRLHGRGFLTGQAQKKLEEAVFTALTKSKLTAKDLSIIAKNKVEAIAKIQDVVDEGTLLRLASNTQIDPDIRYAARVKLGLPVADPRTGTGGTTKAGNAATTAARVKQLTITGT